MLIRYYRDHDLGGAREPATRRLLCEIAVFKSWTVRQVIRALRAGDCVEAGWWRYVWSTEGDVI